MPSSLTSGRVFLWGFMAAGKTSSGQLLAQRLDYRFVDLDCWVERAAGFDVRQIFERWGEVYFRELEHCCLRRCRDLQRTIVAVGGGTPTFERNRRLLEELGTSIWLDVELETLRRRLDSREIAARPLLVGGQRLAQLYRRRRVIYALADHHLEIAADESADDVAARIRTLI